MEKRRIKPHVDDNENTKGYSMESHATVKYLRSAPTKARLVADAVRGMQVGNALAHLDYSIKKAVSHDIAKLLKSAVANMQSRNSDANIDIDTVRIKEIRVDKGPVLRRFRARARGRAGRITKPMCHISVTLTD